MADDNTPNNEKYVRRAHPDLSIESIISAPLVAISKANAMMVTGQAQFLLSIQTKIIKLFFILVRCKEKNDI